MKRKPWKLKILPWITLAGIAVVPIVASCASSSQTVQTLAPLLNGYQANVDYAGAKTDFYASVDAASPGSGSIQLTTLDKYLTVASNLRPSTTVDNKTISFGYAVKNSVAIDDRNEIDYDLEITETTGIGSGSERTRVVNVVNNKLIINSFPPVSDFTFTAKSKEQLGGQNSYAIAKKQLVNDPKTNTISIGNVTTFVNVVDTQKILNQNVYRIQTTATDDTLNIAVTLTVMRQNYTAKSFAFTLVFDSAA